MMNYQKRLSRHLFFFSILALAAVLTPTVVAFLPSRRPGTTTSSSSAYRTNVLDSALQSGSSKRSLPNDFSPTIISLDDANRRRKALQSAVAETSGGEGGTNLTSTKATPATEKTAANADKSTATTAPKSSAATSTSSPSQRKYDMPWSEFQEWALRDNLGKYTVQVHMQDDDTGRDSLQVYTLWRTLSNDVTALSGYPLKFLVDRYQEMLLQDDESNNNNDDDKKEDAVGGRRKLVQTSSDILPYLDGYTFETDGGVSGRVYGIPGVAQGTRIQTTPVAGVESTLQKGYLLTEEGIVYELGLPARSTSSSSGSEARSSSALRDRQKKMAQRAADSLQSAASSELGLADVVENDELVKLGALTAIVLSGAWAMEALSHHLTVNVFWV